MEYGKRAFYLIPFIMFFLLVSSELVERSMYTDGVAYAGLSANLAEGIGSFWNPKLSEIHHYSFHEHPPLVFGMQSLIFQVFGPSIVSERIYAFLIFLSSAFLIVLVWRKAFEKSSSVSRLWFIPITVWLANEVVYHFYPANVLEPTMTLFTLLAVFTSIHSVEKKKSVFLQFALAVLAGCFVYAGTLCKGPVGLFPLSFYALHWVIFRRASVIRSMLLTISMVAAVALLYGITLANDTARVALTKYFDSQVLASLSGERNFEPHFRSSRFYIVTRAFEVLIPNILITAAIILVHHYYKFVASVSSETKKYSALFILIGLTASLPLTISLNQSFYYLLPSMAYFSLGLSVYIGPKVADFFTLKMSNTTSKIITGVACILLIASIGNTIRHWGIVTRRDHVVLNDIERMNEIMPPGAVIGANGEVAELVSYFYRTNRISLDTTDSKLYNYEYIVSHMDSSLIDVEPIKLNTEKYTLYRVVRKGNN
jgi:4-amino-4-deoxy-L-arabinose transferase-like glycosyltransferase